MKQSSRITTTPKIHSLEVNENPGKEILTFRQAKCNIILCYCIYRGNEITASQQKGTKLLAGCIPQLHMASTGVYIIILYIVYYCNIYYYILWYLSFNDIIKEKTR